MKARATLLALLVLVGGALAPARADDDGRTAVRTLKKALRDDDPSTRIAALREMERDARFLPDARRRAAAVAIKKRMEDEEGDADVKAAMMRTLAALGGPTGWIPVILASLDGTDDRVRVEARQAVLWGGGDYLDVVRRLVDEDKDPTFRARLLLLLRDRRKPDAVPLLLAHLDPKVHPRVRSAAAEALEAITGEAFGYDLAAWTKWWEEEGRAATTPTTPTADGETATVTEDRPQDLPEPPPFVGRALHPHFYSLPLTSKDIVFVLDISGSVGTQGVERGKRELIEAVELLGSDVHIAALFFDENLEMWKPEMVPATPENKAALALFLRAIDPGSKTDVFAPLNAGLQIVRRRVLEKAQAGEPIREAVTMIVVSDGKETASSTPPHVVEDKLARLDRDHTVVHVVDLGKGSRLLLQIARLTGGFYISAGR